MADDDRRNKRSRFDRTEPEVKKSSRFDRRSRSPVNRESASGRSRTRSPLRRESQGSPGDGKKRDPSDAAAAAAAAAARINAQLQARKGPQQVDVPPVRSASGLDGKASSPTGGSSNINPDIYIDDGDYIKDIEVNDLRNRYTLTKGSTQKMIKEETGADVTTRGSYYPDKNMATAANPPLYLHVTSTSKTGLEKAVEKIEELMKQELPNLVDERRFRRREPEHVERDELGRRKWPEERIPIDLEPVQGFNLRAQVVGQGGAYVKHIQQETRCRVQIKGRGSGFVDPSTGMESDEPMYLHVAGPDAGDVQKAKELCEDLLQNVKQQYQSFKERPPQQYGGYSNNQGGQRRDQSAYGGYGGYGNAQTSSAASPTTSAPGAPGSATSTDYYSQYYGGQDPYAAYGGYQNYVAYYQYYQQQAAQQQQQQGAPGSTSDAPPPPPSGSAQPPPPPPPSGSPPGTGSYSAVPPPPGM